MLNTGSPIMGYEEIVLAALTLPPSGLLGKGEEDRRALGCFSRWQGSSSCPALYLCGCFVVSASSWGYYGIQSQLGFIQPAGPLSPCKALWRARVTSWHHFSGWVSIGFLHICNKSIKRQKYWKLRAVLFWDMIRVWLQFAYVFFFSFPIFKSI